MGQRECHSHSRGPSRSEGAATKRSFKEPRERRNPMSERKKEEEEKKKKKKKIAGIHQKKIYKKVKKVHK
jgi:hypothetical protein